jgi:hypothetical protein
MLKTKINIKNLDGLKKAIDIISLLQNYKNDEKFQKFIQNKCLEVVSQKMKQLMIYSGALVDEYINNNKIEPYNEGFIIYNDTFVETDAEGYGGKFSIALAFEYGTGIVGQQNPRVNAWSYNVKGRQSGWWYPTDDSDPNPHKWRDKDGNLHAWTRGLMGMEIYRYSSEEINKQLQGWIYEYMKGNGGVSQ